jgi:hypothetical protein
VLQRERVPVDDADGGAAHEERLAAGVDCPRLLRRAPREQHRLRHRTEEGFERFAHL